jgi:hypothetical protein
MTNEAYENLKQAIKNSSCTCNELLQIYKEVHKEQRLFIADNVIKWISKNWKEDYICLSDITEPMICLIKTNALANRIFYILEDQGYLKREQRYVTMRGKIKAYWKIVKRKHVYIA